MTTKWEYQMLSTPTPTASVEQLNELGGVGWQLVTVYPLPAGPKLFVYVFKREVELWPEPSASAS